MTTTPTTPPPTSDDGGVTPRGTRRADAARDHLWLHFARHSGLYEGNDVPIIVRGRGCAASGTTRAGATSTAWPGCSSSRWATAGSELADVAARQAGRARLLPTVVLRPSAGDRPRRAAGGLRPWRPQPGLLHHRRRRGGRDGVEARQAVLEAGRKADEAQGHLPSGRVPRHSAGRVVDHRHPGSEAGVRAAGPWRDQGAEHEPLPRARSRARRRQGVRSVGGRPDRGSDPVRGSGHGSGGVPRAGAELRWLLPAAARVLRAGPRDLRRVRRAARLRRGDLRVRPDRLDVRLRRLRLRPGHDHLRQGNDLRVRADRRDDRVGPPVRAVRQGHDDFPHGFTFGGHPGRGRRRDGQPRHLRAREVSTTTSRRTQVRSGRLWRSCSTCRSSATSVGPATSTASSW